MAEVDAPSRAVGSRVNGQIPLSLLPFPSSLADPHDRDPAAVATHPRRHAAVPAAWTLQLPPGSAAAAPPQLTPGSSAVWAVVSRFKWSIWRFCGQGELHRRRLSDTASSRYTCWISDPTSPSSNSAAAAAVPEGSGVLVLRMRFFQARWSAVLGTIFRRSAALLSCS